MPSPRDSFAGLVCKRPSRVSPQLGLLVFALAQLGLRGAIFDIADGDVPSLVVAIMTANTNGEPDVINLANRGVYSLTSDLPSITDEGPGKGVVLYGNGSVLQRGQLPPPPQWPGPVLDFPPGVTLTRILHVGNGGVLELHRTTIRDGRNAQGAGILNQGRLVLNQCVVSDNLAAAFVGTKPKGGGIFNAGILTVYETTIANNSAVGFGGADAAGGGIYNATGGCAYVVSSCVVSNLARGGDSGTWGASGRGGGIYNQPGATLQVVNSTLSYNLALGGNGGSAYQFGTMTEGGAIYGGDADTMMGHINPISILNSTIAFNTALEGSHSMTFAFLLSQGGGVLGSYRFTPYWPVPLLIRNSIVASNHSGATPALLGLAHESYPDVRGLFTSGGNNLVGIAAGGIGFNPGTDLLGTEDSPLDPLLGPLMSNGGLTPNHELLPGSPAIDAGSTDTNDAPAFDQRGPGFSRIFGGRMDIGAFEVQPLIPPVFSTCPHSIVAVNDPGECSAQRSFLVAASGLPAPSIICQLGTNIIESPFAFPIGTNQVVCTAANAVGTNICAFAVIVRDTEPPVLTSLRATPDVLWPPNHQFENVRLSVNASDNCGPTDCKIISVTSNERHNDAEDGHTTADFRLTGDLTLKLRAERSGKGFGRIYAITVGCKDSAGNRTTRTAFVTVPREREEKEKP